MKTPGNEHSIIFKRVFMYLCGTKDYDICYQGKPRTDSELNVHGFVKVEWDRNMDFRRSTNRYVFKMFSGAIN
jgi:hypothetical protein